MNKGVFHLLMVEFLSYGCLTNNIKIYSSCFFGLEPKKIKRKNYPINKDEV